VSIDRRSQAIAGLQSEAAAAGKPLHVWFTLPVLPTGLTADGLYVLQSALRFGVNIAGVNIMAMDYGDSAAPNPQGKMADYAIMAAESLFTQLRGLYGASKADAQLWGMVGVTPMIGLNDVTTEIFDQQEARELLAFAQQKGIGFLSMWSLNRDQQHPSGRLNYVTDKSSSILQDPFEFSRIFLPFTQ
jgi:chitinase